VKSILAASALLLGLGAAAPAAPVHPGATTRLDHILLWGRSIDEVTSIMAVKLGFQVRAGRDPGGVANRYIRFADTTFVELLGVTRADPAYDPG
jgi:Glyoxalase-like domain